MSISNHTAKQPAFYMEPIAMNQNKFYMPESILRPEGLNVEEMVEAKEKSVAIPAKEVKEAKASVKAKVAKKEA